MQADFEITQQDNAWQVAGNVSIDNALTVWQQSEAMSLMQYINFAHLKEVDTSILSLMLGWQRRAQETKTQLFFVHLPVTLLSLLRLYGVEEFFNIVRE